MKKVIVLGFVFTCSAVFGQKVQRQDIGVNIAGVFIKKQATVAPALFYRYQFNNYQLRFQFCLDGNLLSRNREGKSNNGSFGSFEQDSTIKYEPGKNMRYGVMIGIQKNLNIEFICSLQPLLCFVKRLKPPCLSALWPPPPVG